MDNCVPVIVLGELYVYECCHSNVYNFIFWLLLLQVREDVQLITELTALSTAVKAGKNGKLFMGKITNGLEMYLLMSLYTVYIIYWSR